MTPAFRKSLVAWYERHARKLPWRTRPTPYRVWISEIMLQQTRVQTVRGYFTPFIKRFPTARALANASEDQVLEAWAGLGYYRRARLLHAAAKQIVELHGGRFPRRREDVLALPGVGRYTSGAVLSIAFNKPEPIVDANVERVFARLQALADNVKSKSGQELMWTAAKQHVDQGTKERHAPTSLNQALMELGATVCKPAPKCHSCPVRRWCKALKAGKVGRYPVLPVRAKPKRKRYLFAALLDESNRVLMVKRQPKDRTSLLPAGMWELPHAEWNGSKQAALWAIESAHGIQVLPQGKPVVRDHSIMEYRLQLAVQACSGTARTGSWFTVDRALDSAIASATRKLLKAL